MMVLMIYCLRESSTPSEIPSKSLAILEAAKVGVPSSFAALTFFSSGIELTKALAAASTGSFSVGSS